MFREQELKQGKATMIDYTAQIMIKVMDLSLKYSINSNFMVESKILNLFNDKSIVACRPAGVRPNMPRTFSIGFLFDF